MNYQNEKNTIIDFKKMLSLVCGNRAFELRLNEAFSFLSTALFFNKCAELANAGIYDSFRAKHNVVFCDYTAEQMVNRSRASMMRVVRWLTQLNSEVHQSTGEFFFTRRLHKEGTDFALADAIQIANDVSDGYSAIYETLIEDVDWRYMKPMSSK